MKAPPSFTPPPGYEGGAPSITVTTEQRFYEKPKSSPRQQLKPLKPSPMEVKIVDVAPKARKAVAGAVNAPYRKDELKKGYRTRG